MGGRSIAGRAPASPKLLHVGDDREQEHKDQQSHRVIDAYAWAYIASKSGLETPTEALHAIEQDVTVDALSIEMGRERAKELISQYKLK